VACSRLRIPGPKKSNFEIENFTIAIWKGFQAAAWRRRGSFLTPPGFRDVSGKTVGLTLVSHGWVKLFTQWFV